MPDETPAFGRWLKERRQALGLSRAALADRVHCAPSTVEKLERGDRRPSVEVAAALALALGLPPADHPAFVEWARGLPSGYLVGLPPAPAGRSPLPIPLTPLIGRARVLDDVARLLADPAVRLLTLVGPPGIGKTRLGLALAAALRPAFAAGVCWVALAALHDPALLPATIAAALGLKEAAERPLLATLHDHLRDQALLLVLDNFEQIASAAPLVGALLEGAPGLRVVLTSRAPLHLYGEQEYAVPPLDLPDLAALPPPPALAQNPAVALFTARAVAVNARFRLTGENAAAVAELCVRLEGLPLALELAAARTKRYPPTSLLRQMTRRLPLLVGGPGERTSRQQTMRGAIAWSYDLLSAPEQAVFRALGVFVGGGTAEAVAAVAATAATDVAGRLEGLVDQSLVRSTLDGDTLRFSMLEMIREYAEEQLVAAEEMAAARARHAATFLALAESLEERLLGAEQGPSLARLDHEHDNLRWALRWALDSGDAATAQRLAGALWRFWVLRGHIREGRAWATQALAAGQAHPSWWAKAANSAAILTQRQGDYAEARTIFEAALVVYRAAGDAQGVGQMLNNLGISAWQQGAYPAARAFFGESLALRRDGGSVWDVAATLTNLGLVAADEEDWPTARRYHTEARDLFRAVGDARGTAVVGNNLAGVAHAAGDYPTAQQLWEEGLAHFAALGDQEAHTLVLVNLALLARDQGAWAVAHARTAQALTACLAVGNRRLIASTLVRTASLAVLEGRPELAARLYGAAAALRAVLAMSLPPDLQKEEARYETQAQAALGTAYARERQIGAALSVEAMVQLAGGTTSGAPPVLPMPD